MIAYSPPAAYYDLGTDATSVVPRARTKIVSAATSGRTESSADMRGTFVHFRFATGEGVPVKDYWKMSVHSGEEFLSSAIYEADQILISVPSITSEESKVGVPTIVQQYDDDDDETLRGVFAVEGGHKVICCQEVVINLKQVARWKPSFNLPATDMEPSDE